MVKCPAENKEGKENNEDYTKLLKESTHMGLEIFLFLPAGSTTQNKTVITNNYTTIGLFTTDTSDKNLQPKWAGLPLAIYSKYTPDDGWDCRPKHVE